MITTTGNDFDPMTGKTGTVKGVHKIESDNKHTMSMFKTLPDGTVLDKPAQIADSLRRIREQPHAVWAVKLADRITNLAPPPNKWDRAKCERYQLEAQLILDTLGAGCPPLADRLRARIEAYPASWNR